MWRPLPILTRVTLTFYNFMNVAFLSTPTQFIGENLEKARVSVYHKVVEAV